MGRSFTLRSVLFVFIFVALMSATDGWAAEAPKIGNSILFADEHSRSRFEEYRAQLDKDPERYAAQLATIRQLEQSDIQYVICVEKGMDDRIEGKLSTDGDRALICIADVTNKEKQVTTLAARLAHELEHARQLDSGEFALMRDPASGVWGSQYGSYDIGDEVKAWKAQLAVADVSDFWMRRKGVWVPSLLRLFSNEQTDDGRARVLRQHGYANVNPVFNSNVLFASTSGYAVGQVVRPDTDRRSYMFARVHGIAADLPGRVDWTAGASAGE